MKPPIEFRPRAGHMGSPARKEAQKMLNQLMRSQLDAIAALSHKRAVKAAQMRRYRAARKAKSP